VIQALTVESRSRRRADRRAIAMTKIAPRTTPRAAIAIAIEKKFGSPSP
jgi:hypothetical protein